MRSAFVLLPLLATLPGHAVADDLPCATAIVVFLGAAPGGDATDCSGAVTCPPDAVAPCHWNVEARIEGVGLVNVAVRSEGQDAGCAILPSPLACTAHLHFQHAPGTSRPWTCWADETTTAADVRLACQAHFDGIR